MWRLNYNVNASKISFIKLELNLIILLQKKLLFLWYILLKKLKISASAAYTFIWVKFVNNGYQKNHLNNFNNFFDYIIRALFKSNLYPYYSNVFCFTKLYWTTKNKRSMYLSLNLVLKKTFGFWAAHHGYFKGLVQNKLLQLLLHDLKRFSDDGTVLLKYQKAVAKKCCT